MRRLVRMALVACLLAIALIGWVGVIVPDICQIVPWWPGCPDPDPSGGGGGGGVGR